MLHAIALRRRQWSKATRCSLHPSLGLGEAASCGTQLLSAQEEDIVFSKALSRIGIFNVKIIRWDIINVLCLLINITQSQAAEIICFDEIYGFKN